MIIKRGTTSCIVRSATPAETAWLADQLTYTQGRGMGAEKVCHLRQIPGKSASYFGAGFIRFVQRAAKLARIAVTIEDARVRPMPVPPLKVDASTVQLLKRKHPWYFQWEGASALVRAEHGVVELPTGSGKTVVATILAAVFAGRRVLYAVGDAVLAESTAAAFEEDLGVKVGRDVLGTELVTCTTLQKLHSQLKTPKMRATTLAALKKVQVFIVDEAHGVPALTFTKVCAACPAYYRFAMSATAFDRSDKKSAPLLSLFGGLVYRKTEGELADLARVHPDDKPFLPPGAAYLPKAEIRMVRFQQAAIFLGKYPEAYEAMVLKNAARHDLIADMAQLAKKPCLVLVADVKNKHGESLRRRLDMMGFTVETVDGQKTDKKRRLDVIERLNAGTLDIVVATGVFNVGINVPNLRSVVMARGMQSAVMTVQGLGRGMRLTWLKRTFEVWDALDISVNFQKAKGAWIARHAHERLKTYRSRGWDVLVGDSPHGPWDKLPGVLPPLKKAGKAQKQAEEAA